MSYKKVDNLRVWVQKILPLDSFSNVTVNGGTVNE